MANSICCLNPICSQPVNVVGTKYCQNCGNPLTLLRNRYQATRFLGEGGFGRTFIAEDRDRLNTLCVVKQLVPQLPPNMTVNEAAQTFQIAQRLFEQEAQQLEKLGEHPQIPSLLAYFEADRFFYLVQQFINGLPLDKVRNGQWTEQQVIAFLLDILPVLDYVHQRGVIHRDIKPQNILQRKDNGQYILIDFGAAKVSLTAQQGTLVSLVIGTQGYAPYEQVDRNNPTQKVYPATDLYSLGVTCFYLLTGKDPDYLVQHDGYNWVKYWRNYLPRKLSPELDGVLDKLLQKKYYERYQSARDVIQFFYQKTQAISVRNQPTIQSSTSTNPASLESMIIRWGFAVAKVAKSIEVSFTSSEWYVQGNNLYNAGRYKEAIASYDKALQIKPDKYEAWLNRGNALSNLGRNQEAITNYDKALQIKPDFHYAWYSRGNALANMGRNEEAIIIYDKALQIKPDYHEAWHNRGNALNKLGRNEEAIRSYDKALQIKSDKHESWCGRGVALSNLGRSEEAIASFDKALQIKPDEKLYQNNRVIALQQVIVEPILDDIPF